ncbi:MAG: hypothetical protein IJ855_04380 [Bacteroidales bacterium]|nr:hypothetical protein [Bacteroidales bacterium]
MSRKLASIQMIHDIVPIPDADRIELAKVLGWQCVVPKGQFREGDLCVYFEIDSFLPVRSEFEFLRSNSYVVSDILGEGYRIKTKKMKGQLSQGLVLSLSTLPELAGVSLGEDVSEALGVRKWEVEERATTGGTIIGELPEDVPHTDETRIQAEPGLLQAFAGKDYYITTKMDGSSHSLSIDREGRFWVCGHNYAYKDDGKCSFYEFVKSRGYEKAMRSYMEKAGIYTLTVQGEFCAPGIQGNRLKLTKPEWYVFTVRINGKRAGLHEMIIATETLGMRMVPIEEMGTDLPHLYPTVEALLERAEGSYPNGGPKEGIVVRPEEPVFCPLVSGPLSMKVINNKYLLKND